MQLAIRELKAGLSRALALAQAGETIEITSHKKPVARIVGIPAAEDAGLARLAAAGGVTLGQGKPALAPPVVLEKDGVPVSRMVLEDRR